MRFRTTEQAEVQQHKEYPHVGKTGGYAVHESKVAHRGPAWRIVSCNVMCKLWHKNRP